MKKIFIFVLCVLIGFTSCKQNENGGIQNQKRFAKYFDENCSNYAFLVRNPMLCDSDEEVNPSYFEKLGLVKGRLIKSEWEKYYLDNDGKKHGGFFSGYDRRRNKDGRSKKEGYRRSWSKYTGYMKFDRTGQVQYSYRFEEDSILGLEKLIYTEYIYTQDKYFVNEYVYGYLYSGFELIEKDTYEYTITQTQTQLIFESPFTYEEDGIEIEVLDRYIFEKGKIRHETLFFDAIFYEAQYDFNGNKTTYNFWEYNGKSEDDKFLGITAEYERGKKMFDRVFTVQGYATNKYNFTTKNSGTIHTNYADDSGVYDFYFERKYGFSGFLKHSYERPQVNHSYGYYTTYNAKKLLFKDKYLKTYLQELDLVREKQ